MWFENKFSWEEGEMGSFREWSKQKRDFEMIVGVAV